MTFLVDLVDATNESQDELSLPASYVADVMKNCSADYQNERSIDELVYCFERTVDPALHGQWNLFPTESPPGSLFESATEPAGWSRTGVRKAWLWNFYLRTTPLP